MGPLRAAFAMKERNRRLCLVFPLAALLAAVTPAFAAEDFTVVVFPDTQIYAQSHPEIFRSQAEWIVAHEAALNIKMVLHEGDVVNRGASDPIQWSRAKEALDLIDKAGIPLFIALGNHDYDDQARTRRSTFFNRFFGTARYEGKPWFGGVFEPGKSDNVYGFVEAGGRRYVVLALEFAPRQAVVDWANQVIAEHPDHDVMIVTHNYLFSDGTHHDRLNQTGTYGVSVDANNGEELWRELVSRHRNIVLVVSGHVGGDGVARRIDFGIHGNLVHQLVTNFQFGPLGGEGYLRIMRFRPDAGVIEVQTYSPYLDRYLTDADAAFTLPYNPSDREWDPVRIQVQAVDRETGRHLPGGLATLYRGDESLNAERADADGVFRFTVPADAYRLVVTAGPDYVPATLHVTGLQPGQAYDETVALTSIRSVLTHERPVYAGLGGRLDGPRAEGTETDILMMNRKIAVKIAATFDDPQLSGVTLGKPIDVAASGLTDGIDWINMPYLSEDQPVWSGSGGLPTVRFETVEVVRVTNEAAVVEAQGVYTASEDVRVRNTYTIRPDQEWVEVVTTVQNTGDEDLTLWAGDTMDNDDGRQFAYVPGVGEIRGGRRRPHTPTEPWVGHYGDAPQGYALVYDDSFEGFINFGAHNTIMTQKEITVPAGGAVQFRRFIVAVSSVGYAHKMDAVRDVVAKIFAQD